MPVLAVGTGILIAGGNDNIVETYVSYLRRKVDRFQPPLIHTVRGAGYSLRLPSA